MTAMKSKPAPVLYSAAHVLVFAVLFFSSSSIAHSQAAKQNHDPGFELPRKVQKSLDNQVFPAMQADQDDVFLQSYGPLISKASPELSESIEEYAREQKVDSPLKHFVGLKFMRVEQGLDAIPKRPNLRQAILLVQGITQRLDDFQELTSDHPFMQDPIEVPTDWKAARDLFWDVHVLKNEYSNNLRLVEFGLALLQPIKNRIKKSKDPNVTQAVEEFEESTFQLNAVQQQLVEREAEARLNRFNRSLGELKSKPGFESKFIAAMNIELDAEVLVPYLASKAGKLNRRALQSPDLATDIQNQLKSAREAEPALLKKAHWFRAGAHQWLRGRYGHGPMAEGLLKSPQALSSPDAMIALYMPRERPQPDESLLPGGSLDGAPYYKRRHYYTWAIEFRPIVSEYSRTSRQTSYQSDLVSETVNFRQRREQFFY